MFRGLSRPLLVLIFATVTLGVLMTTPGSTQESTKLRLGTATPGGGFPVYGAAFIAAVQGADAGLAIEAINTKGSTENVPMLEEKRLDIALVQGEVVHEVLTGVGRPPANLKIITAMYSTPGMFVVRADSAYRGIADLEGKPVAFGAAGSGLVILARYVLGARFIVPDKAEIARILAKHKVLKPLTLAAGMFPGQDKALESVGSWSFVMARPDLDEAVAYRLAKALHKGEATIAAKLPQAAETTARNTASAVPDPAVLHPGVRRYLREAGLLK
jgi:TRAP-type uncharacterized transport system substrate-binding protein